jgi:hypothetical protein
MFGQDPGPCPICGAAHCSCGGGPILVEQLPQRDAAARASSDPSLGTVAAPVAETEAGGSAPLHRPKPNAFPVTTEAADDHETSLGDGSNDQPFSTATYRGTKKPRGSSSRA